MRYTNLVLRSLLCFGLVFAFSASTAVAKDKKMPDLTKACSKECPNVASNDEALRCVDDMEKNLGESSFKKQHKSCYKAHEKYEKMTGKKEAGEAGRSGRSRDSGMSQSSSSNQNQ